MTYFRYLVDNHLFLVLGAMGVYVAMMVASALYFPGVDVPLSMVYGSIPVVLVACVYFIGNYIKYRQRKKEEEE